MKKRNIFGMMAASLMLLFGSCSSEVETDSMGDGSSFSGKAGVVRFTLGGSAGGVLTRATTATPSERVIESLYAVVFKDGTNAAETGTNDRETNHETFYKCINVFEGGGILSDGTHIFDVGEPGAYQICFVANPSRQLKEDIEGLGSKTVADFKQLEEDRDPGDGLMLMTSGFFGATVSNAQDADLGTVRLTRAMARIDLVNKAPDITLTKAVFKNRAVTTVLIADNAQESFHGIATTVYDLNLVGTAEGAEYEGRIYSYEQYATQEADAPSIEITYVIAGTSYTHKVAFKTDTSASTQIPLKRNHLYKVTLSNKSGKLNLELSVADWDKGETFTVSSQSIGEHSTGPVVDVMLKDGSIVASSELTEEQKAAAIGIVAYLYKDQTRVGDAVKTKLGRDAKGLVLALKNANAGSRHSTWGPTDAVAGTAYIQLGNAYANGFDGYSIYQEIQKKPDWQTVYPAFGAVETFGKSIVAPSNTTGWYLPSIGEWADLLGMDGIGKVDISAVKGRTNSYVYIPGAAPVAVANLNAALEKAGNADKFALNDWFWSSSEISANNAYYLYLDSVGDLGFYGLNKSNFNGVRCVLAF